MFDDSGSMYKDTDRWAYTSYAMQAFAAMMGQEDVLYVTYLNGSKKVKADLSSGGKDKTISGFQSVMFGGGTPDRVQEGADCLTAEYAKYKTNAKYYLVVMSDGELDSGSGQLASRVRTVDAATKAKLAGADFETIYFSMKSKDDGGISGITSHYAASSEKIVDALKKVSADIMGRTTISHSVSGKTLTFTLPYPALNIAVFSQKQNGNFANFNAGLKVNGKTVSCQAGHYNVVCPTQIVKNYNTSVFEEKVPDNPPAGVVSLFSSSAAPLEKGTYTMDLSGYDLSQNDIVVLVEPAVRIGCQYRLNDDDDFIAFEELKKRVTEGDKVTVVCGLFELKADGSCGDTVPLDVLSPSYKILVNGNEVGKTVDGKNHTYSFEVTKDFEEKELKVEASLAGYQPFVLKETFGKLNITLKPIPFPEGADVVALTKPLWKKWSTGEEGISFALEKIDAATLERVAIEVEGVDGLPEGSASELKNAIRLDGNTIVYFPLSTTDFAKLPQSFTVKLMDMQTGASVLEKKVHVVTPSYRFEIQNQLEGESLSLNQLKDNNKAITFTLMVDYEGKGQYIPVSESDCEGTIDISISSEVLPVEVKKENGVVSAVVSYDLEKHKDISADKVVGKTHQLTASATVDGKQIASDSVSVSVSSASYRLVVENKISGTLTLDTLRNNGEKVIFYILADYEGNGNYGDLAAWDKATVENLIISTGDLPGKTETVYDAGGNAIGKAFIPLYDEHNSNGIPFTKVAGKTHKVEASIENLGVRAETQVQVQAPKYDVIVREQGVTLINTYLQNNQKGVSFVIMRDGRALTVEELAGLAPYNLYFDAQQPHLSIQAEPKVAENGEAYLFCAPQYGSWGLLGFFAVKLGEMNVVLNLGGNETKAAVTFVMSKAALIGFLVSLGILLVAAWIIFAACSKIRFCKGKFYRVSFSYDKSKGCSFISTVNHISPDSRIRMNSIKAFGQLFNRFKALFIPFTRQTCNVTITTRSAKFVASKPLTNKLFARTYPSSDKSNEDHIKVGMLESTAAINAIITKDKTAEFDPGMLEGKEHPNGDYSVHDNYFVTDDGKTILIYLTAKKVKQIKKLMAPAGHTKRKKK
ncbi:MAG: hypothetical protein E7448_07160 [Ruminococcaceae bacterium]|nr:hypothetical protein [Oscillospiraceae bacterium]